MKLVVALSLILVGVLGVAQSVPKAKAWDATSIVWQNTIRTVRNIQYSRVTRMHRARNSPMQLLYLRGLGITTHTHIIKMPALQSCQVR